MLIVLQHNVAHLGIATGLCLSEAATIYLKPWISKSVLSFAVFASVSTSLAEILGERKDENARQEAAEKFRDTILRSK